MAARTRQWTEVGTGARSASQGWGWRCGLPPRRGTATRGSGWRCRSRRRGKGIEANVSGPPPPRGSPAPRPRGSCRGGPGGCGPLAEPAARAEGVRGREGPGAPHIPPALIPPAHLSQRRAPRGPYSPLLLPPPPVQRKPPPPPPPASGPVISAAPQSARSGPVPPLPAVPSPSEQPSRRRRLNPAPPPTPARLEGKGGGRGATAPSPFTSSWSVPSHLLLHTPGHAGIWSPACAGPLGVSGIQNYYFQKIAREP